MPLIEDRAVEEQKAKLQSIAELNSKAFERASAYVNVVVIGGYASAFTVWSFTKAQLTPRATVSVALALLISLTTFVVFEIYKMVRLARQLISNSRLVTKEQTPDAFNSALKLAQAAEYRQNARLVPIWVGALTVCVLSAVTAGGILIYNFLAILLGGPAWP